MRHFHLEKYKNYKQFELLNNTVLQYYWYDIVIKDPKYFKLNQILQKWSDKYTKL